MKNLNLISRFALTGLLTAFVIPSAFTVAAHGQTVGGAVTPSEDLPGMEPAITLAGALASSKAEFAKTEKAVTGYAVELEMKDAHMGVGTMNISELTGTFIFPNPVAGSSLAVDSTYLSSKKPKDVTVKRIAAIWPSTPTPVNIETVLNGDLRPLTRILQRVTTFDQVSLSQNYLLITTVRAALGARTLTAAAYPLQAQGVADHLKTLDPDMVIAVASEPTFLFCEAEAAPYEIFNVTTGDIIAQGTVIPCPEIPKAPGHEGGIQP